MQQPNVTVTKQPYSALTVDQWAELHNRVFADAGESLTALEDWARSRYLPPIGATIMAAQRALTALPAGTTYDAGLGPGSLNTLVALVGRPGQGKDRLAANIAGELTICQGNRTIEPIEAALGSGEGVAAKCAPDEETGTPADPIIFGESEAGRMESLMNRTGSTLRQTIMSIYSGNALGASNKHESTYVPRNSYTAGLWVGVQPDKAGALLGGADDGLAHRFIWTELIDPGATPTELTHPKAVDIPRDIGLGIFFPEEVVKMTRQSQRDALMFGALGDHMGHRHQTRLKLAAGLALLRSTRTVDMDDWARSGALMDYSDTVRRWCLNHMEMKSISDEADRMERRESVDDQVHLNRVQRNRKRILEALADETSLEAVPWSPLLRARPGRERESMSEALQQLINEGAVMPNLDEENRTESLSQGPKFNEICDRDSVSHSLKAVS